ncbi:hypothetical protein RAVI111496_10300 [Rahnella victoriana]
MSIYSMIGLVLIISSLVNLIFSMWRRDQQQIIRARWVAVLAIVIIILDQISG